MIRMLVRAIVLIAWGCATVVAADIPRPEHPDPGAVRPHWANLNGAWAFRFDPKDEGLKKNWSQPDAPGFDQTITVPFGWESELSGIHRTDYRGVAWYRRTFEIPAEFPKGDHVWLHFGAVDWKADVWVNGEHVAEHEGGYTPFSADITAALARRRGVPAVVTVRAFDPTDPNLPTGKQVGWYTPTSGIWQTVWLESRPVAHIAGFTVTTKVEKDFGGASYRVRLAGLKVGEPYSISVKGAGSASGVTFTAAAETAEQSPGGPGWNQPKLWTPKTPVLDDVTLELTGPQGSVDSVKTYFGLRSITRGRYGDEPYERILLNGRPIYLRAALDQSFNPKGLYTAPNDDFFKRDMIIAKVMGLNGLRIHIKPDEPRRLYWADHFGILILEDMPNTWRQNAAARKAWEQTMREVVARDRNHPAIIAWVAFNETWGLGDSRAYKSDRDTQRRVGSMVATIRQLDPTRLIEDNSPCNYDHIEGTDLNSWHFYIEDHEAAQRHIAEVVARTEPGSGFNYCPGLKQLTVPLINSEYGAVSAGGGDRDISWGLRDLTTLLRRQPKIQGYVYTELTDIEWEHNGLVNYDRTPKQFGYDAFVPGMQANELMGDDFIGFEGPPAIVGRPGQEVTIPVFISHFSDRKGPPRIRWWCSGFDDRGNLISPGGVPQTRPGRWAPFNVTVQEPVTVRLPARPFVGAVLLTLRDENNRRIAANFVNVVVKPESSLPRIERQGEREVVIRFSPHDFARQHWSGPSASRDGTAYGQGRGFFEYRLMLPDAVAQAHPEEYDYLIEASSHAGRERVDWPQRVNRQDNPQTDVRRWPSTLEVSPNGNVADRFELSDDPADARGVLSHLAGSGQASYGEMVDGAAKFSAQVQADLAAGKPLVIRLAVPEGGAASGGLCVYGANWGQYPFDPTFVIRTKEKIPADLGAPANRPLTIKTTLRSLVPPETRGGR